jgi:hypothetical protein
MQSTLPHGVMESRGAYNKYATIPASGAALAAPFLENAIRAMAVDNEDRPVVIADYGSSQGKNSLAPMGLAFELCGRACARTARFSSFTSNSQRTTSTPCSAC